MQQFKATLSGMRLTANAIRKRGGRFTCLAIKDACNAEAVATLTFLFSSVTSDHGETIDLYVTARALDF